MFVDFINVDDLIVKQACQIGQKSQQIIENESKYTGKQLIYSVSFV